MQLEELPQPIMALILDYKAEFERLERFQRFLDYIMNNLLFV